MSKHRGRAHDWRPRTPLPTLPAPVERTSWWTEPTTREEFSDRVKAMRSQLANSREGLKIRTWDGDPA